MTELRPYQQRTVDQLYDWFASNDSGNPCIVMPTGSGKSHIVAWLCRDALQNWPETQILVLTHVKELIEQNVEKMRQYWPDAPMGIYSASIGVKHLGNPITFAGIQSICKKSEEIGHVDLVIIDECHLVNHKESGQYREFLKSLYETNPALRVIGLTATPYRLGHGMLTDPPAMFNELLTPVSIEELVAKKYLAPLHSKHTNQKLDTTGVKKRGGDFIESELQKAVDTDPKNRAIVQEIIDRAGDRKAWLIFCTGVDHAQHIADELLKNGVATACVTGKTPKREREQILDAFKKGFLRAVTNANVLTTGFDYPDLDLIAMLRPTLSPGLYVQMAGRGMRMKSHTDHCMVLDFAGVVATHGPITAVQPPKPPNARKEAQDAPMKACPECHELLHPRVMVCPACGYQFPEPERKELKLHHDDIMGLHGSEMHVTEWQWRKHLSRTSGKEMLKVSYYGALSDPAVTEYFPVTHDGYAGDKARTEVARFASRSGCPPLMEAQLTLDATAGLLTIARPPATIEYKRDGKFFRVLKRNWG